MEKITGSETQEYTLTAEEREVLAEIERTALLQMQGAVTMLRATHGLAGAWALSQDKTKLVRQ